ncbi:MAG: hypothetical protein Q7U99_16190 [Rubrivivax sp.]|nr:hypothetical protein [Rubrivivax sp.]MDP3225179.1 hypothetical protein [Rubrivivax sp.]
MSNLSHSIPSANFGSLLSGLTSLLRDTGVMIDAMLFPGRIIAEVSEMRALRVQADRLEASDPAGAVLLRQRAARIGL